MTFITHKRQIMKNVLICNYIHIHEHIIKTQLQWQQLFKNYNSHKVFFGEDYFITDIIKNCWQMVIIKIQSFVGFIIVFKFCTYSSASYDLLLFPFLMVSKKNRGGH